MTEEWIKDSTIDPDTLDISTVTSDNDWANSVPFISNRAGNPDVTAAEAPRQARAEPEEGSGKPPQGGQEAAGEEPGQDDQGEAEEAAPDATQAGQEAADDGQGEEAPEPEEAARIAKLARDLREERRRLRKLEAQNAALRGEREETVDEQTERLIEQRAAQKAAQQIVAEKVGTVISEGYKAYGKAAFDEAAANLAEDLGDVAFNNVRDAILDLPNAHQLVKHLADNPDIAESIATLTPARMGIALAREADKLNKPKAISKAPPPPKPINVAKQPAKAAKSELDMTMAELAALTRQQMQGKRIH